MSREPRGRRFRHFYWRVAAFALLTVTGAVAAGDAITRELASQLSFTWGGATPTSELGDSLVRPSEAHFSSLAVDPTWRERRGFTWDGQALILQTTKRAADVIRSHLAC